MSERVTASLAILKVNWDKGSDNIENFVPFLTECVRGAPQPEVSLPQLQTLMADTFGLQISQDALNTILKRAARRSYVRLDNKIYVRNDQALERSDLPRVRDDDLRRHESLVTRLVDFCKEPYTVTWSHDKAETELPCALLLASSLVVFDGLAALAEHGRKLGEDTGVVAVASEERPWTVLLAAPLPLLAIPAQEIGRRAAALTVPVEFLPGDLPR